MKADINVIKAHIEVFFNLGEKL